MFKTVSEGMNVFRKALREFKAHAQELELTSGHDPRVHSKEEWLPWKPRQEPHGLGTEQVFHVRKRFQQLKGMAAALGLTSEEERDAYVRAGLEVAE
jgi:hypothetical protein